MNKKLKMLRFLFFCFLILSKVSLAQSNTKVILPKPAYPRLFNDDRAFAYYHSEWRRLENKLINHYKTTGNQIVLIITSSLENHSIEDVANETFRNWGIGDKKENTGLLVLITRKEMQINITTGYGLESKVTDLESGELIREILKPGLDSFNFQLPPMHIHKGYLPTIESAIDRLISLTKQKNIAALNGIVENKKAKRRHVKYTILLIFGCTASLIFLISKAQRLLNKIK